MQLPNLKFVDKSTVQVFDKKDDKGFVKEALERYPDLANMRKWVHWVLYQKCQIQYLCLCLLDGFRLHLNIYVCLDQYSLFSIRIEVMVIVYYFGPRIILIWVCDGFYTLGILIFCRYASLCIRNNILSIWHYKWCCNFLWVCD